MRVRVPLMRVAAVQALVIATALTCAAARVTQASTDHAEPAATPVAIEPVPESLDLDLVEARVTFLEDLDLLLFEQVVKGTAGGTIPKKRGALNGAPVLGYVFPTTLPPTAVGFGATEGTLALAVTSHPDFDDSHLWDENGDGSYDNDGATWHTHWVVLVPDKRVGGGLSVKEFRKADGSVVLPPTAPDMPMYMDSPGFSVLTRGDTLKVLIPAQRVSRKTDFNFDGVTAYMQVSTAPETPMLGVYKVYDVLSGDLKLPYSVKRK